MHLRKLLYRLKPPALYQAQDQRKNLRNRRFLITLSVIVLIAFLTATPTSRAQALSTDNVAQEVRRTIRKQYIVNNQNIAGRETVRVMSSQNLEEELVSDDLSHFYLNHLGTVAVIDSESDGVITAVKYGPFGNIWAAYSNSGSELGRGFTGHRATESNGLIYMNARYYLPESYQFISPDSFVPIPNNPQTINRYAYVANNPINYTDPTGHWLESALDIAFISYDIYEIRRDGLNWQNGLALTADVAGLALPFVTGGGLAVRAVTHADDAVDAAQAINRGTDTYTAAQASNRASDGYSAANTADRVTDAINVLCSFSADTPVWTANGMRPISEIKTGDYVWGRNPANQEVGLHPVLASWHHTDDLILNITIGNETIVTTPEHPFWKDGEFVPAAHLAVGDQLSRPDGTLATITNIAIKLQPQPMYNLSVGVANSYFVGNGQWLVHNTCVPLGFNSVDEFHQFGDHLYDGLQQAGFNGADALFQGSSVTGYKYTTGAAFDVGRVSDYDIALTGPELMERARAAGIQLRSRGTRTGPLHASDLEALGLTQLREILSEMAGRPVNFMIYESAEAAAERSPSILVPSAP